MHLFLSNCALFLIGAMFSRGLLESTICMAAVVAVVASGLSSGGEVPESGGDSDGCGDGGPSPPPPPPSPPPPPPPSAGGVSGG